jgi:hypothetical protein
MPLPAAAVHGCRSGTAATVCARSQPSASPVDVAVAGPSYLAGCGVPATPANDVLPDVAQLLNAHRFDQKVHCPMGDAPQHGGVLTVGGHHCKQHQQQQRQRVAKQQANLTRGLKGFMVGLYHWCSHNLLQKLQTPCCSRAAVVMSKACNCNCAVCCPAAMSMRQGGGGPY